LEAEIRLEYSDEWTAEAIAKAISPDNFKVPNGLSVKTVREGKCVLTCVMCKRKLASFIATIDDLLFCASTAEKALQTVQRRRLKR
jgi:hypothetical protein